MPGTAEARQTAAGGATGAYLTDGENLWWVAGRTTGRPVCVLLEDCRRPDGPLKRVTVKELTGGKFRRVVPDPS